MIKHIIYVALIVVATASSAFCTDYSKEAVKYIEAAKKKDIRKLFQMDYMMALARKNSPVTTSSKDKSRDIFMEETLNHWKERTRLEENLKSFPPSMTWKIKDITKTVHPNNPYEKYKNWTVYSVVIEANYPKPEEAPFTQDGLKRIRSNNIIITYDAKTNRVLEIAIKNAIEVSEVQ